MHSGAPPAVDIVVPVHGGLRHVRACFDSLSRWTGAGHRLIVVDDASDAHTRDTVVGLVADDWGARGMVLVNERNLGFLRTANRGMREGTAPIVVLLNSDTLVSPGWVEGLTACIESREDVGVVSPLSNNANLTRIGVPYGTDHRRIAEAVRRVSPRRYPEIHLASGMCFVVRRALLEELDYFDERYGRGYYEESDFCLRAAERGWRTVADDTTYVHHHGWGSFGSGERNELMQRNAALFGERWGPGRHKRLRRQVMGERHFAELERRLRVALADSAQIRPRRSLPRTGTRLLAEHAREASPVTTHRRPPTSALRPLAEWTRLAERPPLVHDADREVLVLVDDLEVDPASSEVLQLADRLLQRGLDVSVATSGRFDAALFVDPCRLRPFVLSGPDELLATVPSHRVVLATSPATVFDGLLLRDRDGSVLAGWFDPQAVAPSLGWPQEGWSTAMAPRLVDAHLGPAVPLPAPDDIRVHDVPLGVDPEVYPPRPLSERPPRVLLTHHREAGPRSTADTRAAVEQLHERGIEVTVYGDPPDGVEVASEPLAPQSVEAPLLADHAVVAEIGPLPGMERFRLRCAATGTPLVLAGPTTPSCPLAAGDEAYTAPRGDVARAVDLAVTVLTRPEEAAIRVAAARERALSRPLQAEAAALADAVTALGARA